MTPAYWRSLLLMLLVAAAVLAAGMGLRDPWPADEPRFALIARDMALSGNWLIPYIGGVPYPDKPPVFFWLIGLAYLLTGSFRVAFLLPGFLAGIGILLLVTDLARRLRDEKTALWSGATLLVLLQFPLQAKSAQIDVVLCFFTTLGLYGFLRHLLLGPDWRWYTVGGLAAGLGVITKGVGFLPYLVLVPWLFARYRKWALPSLGGQAWRWSLAPLASLAVIAAWLVPMLLLTSGSNDPALAAYRDNILFRQTVTRYVDPWGHIKPFWYLFTNAVPWLWLPVTALLPWLVPAWWRDIRARQAPVLVLGGWALLVLLFFSMSDGKRSVYIFPAAPAVALLAGWHADALFRRVGPRRVLAGVAAVLAILLAGAGAWVLFRPGAALDWSSDPRVTVSVAVSLLVVGVAMLAALLATRRARLPIGYAIAMATFWLGISLAVAPSIDPVRSGSALIDRVRANVPEGVDLGFAAWPEQFLLQWDQPVTHFGYRRRDTAGQIRDALSWLAASDARRLLVEADLLPGCLDPRGLIDIGMAHRRNWTIVEPGAVVDDCSPLLLPQPEIVYRYEPPER
jgi:4-amino-4-deoxy-L-arabinose transferase-like glycosyltransferase